MSVFLGDYSIHGKRPSVEEELAKHGSHNQKTHGGKGGSGGGGGGTNKPLSELQVQNLGRAESIIDEQITDTGAGFKRAFGTPSSNMKAGNAELKEAKIHHAAAAAAAKKGDLKTARAEARLVDEKMQSASISIKNGGDSVDRLIGDAVSSAGAKYTRTIKDSIGTDK